MSGFIFGITKRLYLIPILSKTKTWKEIKCYAHVKEVYDGQYGPSSLDAIWFIDFNDNKLTLMTDLSAGEVPENIESEFKSAISSVFNKDIEINYENGNVNESPIILENKKMEDNINNAQSNINNDESIKSFVKKFKGSIKKDSIKPLK